MQHGCDTGVISSFFNLSLLFVCQSTEMTRRYKGRPSRKSIARDFPHVVEIAIPPGGLGKQLNAMYAFHQQRSIQVAHLPHRHTGDRDYLRWCFARRAIAEQFGLSSSGR
jgi:hypothetical protein